MAKSKARFLADVLQDDGSSIFVGNFAVPADFVIDPAGSPTGLGNASLENSSITINSYDTALGSSVTLVTDDINEGGSPTNLYFTNARAQAAFTGGTGVTLTGGSIAIGQSVETTDNVTFNQVTATVPYDNSVSGLTATNVQSAITELNTLLGGGNVGSQATYNVYEYTTAGNDTQFDLSALSPAGSYIPGYVQVYLNGLLLSESDYTAVDGSTINFSPAITNAGQLLYIIAYDSFNTAEILRVTSIDASASTNSIAIDANDDVSLVGSLSFADNEKAIFGADSDLQIYHDGTHSRIVDAGTGNLNLQGDNLRLKTADAVGTYLEANNGGAVTITYNGSPKLATTSTGIDVTGTVTADAAKIENSTTSTVTISESTGGGTAELRFIATESFPKTKIVTDVSAASLSLETLGNERLNIANNGDISFYEDTGTTAEFFWDASTERLGIGNSSPATKLHIASGINDTPTTLRIENLDTTIETDQEVNSIEFYTNDASASGTGVTGKIVQIAANPGNQYDLAFYTYNTSLDEAMRLTENGNVGIGTDSPSVRLDTRLGTTTGKVAEFHNSVGYGIGFTVESDGGVNTINSESNQALAFATNGASNERMRIDSSGNISIYETLTLGNTDATTGDIRIYDTGNNQLQLSGIGSNDFLVDLLGTSAVGTLKFNDYYVSIDVNDGTDALTLISSTTGIAGPQLDFNFEKATPADNDVVGRINFNGRNSAAEGITYARIDGKSSQVLDGAETGELSFSTRKNTSQFEEVLRINNTGEMIFASGIEIYQATAGISNTIAIGTSAVQSQYPYQRIDSFSTDASGYFWAFGAHDNDPNSTSIKMLINDSQTVDEVTVIGALKVRDFVSNEYNSSYPTFSTTGVTLNSDGDIEATGDIKLPAGFHISRQGSLSSVSLITQRYVFTHNSNNTWGSCIIEYAVTGTLGTSSSQNYKKGIITFTKYSGDATPMRNQLDTAIIAGSGISVTITDNSANQFTIDFSISGTSGSRYIASTLDVTASEILITDVAHSVF